MDFQTEIIIVQTEGFYNVKDIVMEITNLFPLLQELCNNKQYITLQKQIVIISIIF